MATNLTDSVHNPHPADENKFNQIDLFHQIALTLLPGVGAVTLKNLVSYCGSPQAVFSEHKKALVKIPNIGEIVADKIKSGKHEAFNRAEAEVHFILKHSIKHVFYTDKNYPKRLKNCADAPALLFYKGALNFNASKILGIVGTRAASEYGKSITEKFVHDLSVYSDLIVVSGLAYGIDICAHKACLKHKVATVGVIAHGLDKMYPSNHKAVADKMMDNGAVVTEFISGTKPDRENFPMRNRIVAGMCDAIIVIESAKKGGALITAEIANSYNRDVFAVPGNIDKEFSQGCNLLISQNKANLVQSIADVEYFMGWDQQVQQGANTEKQFALFVDLTEDEKKLVDFLRPITKADIDTICFDSGIKSSKIPSLLLTLEFKGLVKALPGKVYEMV
jgi:DNA processing protein